MKRAGLALLVVPLIAVWLYGCDQASNPVESEAAQVAAPAPLFAVTKIEVCHLNGDGDYVLISVSDNAFPAHVGHGDKAAVAGTCDAPSPPQCDLIQFAPSVGAGYVDYKPNEGHTGQEHNWLQEDLVVAVKAAAASVSTEGNAAGVGFGDMSLADGSTPATQPLTTHRNGVDIDFSYFQSGADNAFRYICADVDSGNGNCSSTPDFDARRTALFIARLAENPRLRVVGLDELARQQVEAALDQLVVDGLVDPGLRASIPLASGASFGWTFMAAVWHVSYVDLCSDS